MLRQRRIVFAISVTGVDGGRSSAFFKVGAEVEDDSTGFAQAIQLP